MNRNLTKRESTLLLILAIVIIALGYFKIVYEPINTKASEYDSMTLEEGTEVDAKTAQAVKMTMMEKEIEKVKATGVKKDVPTYDNSEILLPKLYKVMNAATEYSMDFQDLVTEGNVVSREIGITFTTSSYAKARDIIDDLYGMEYAMVVGDISTYSAGSGTSSSSYTTTIDVTFYEAVRN